MSLQQYRACGIDSLGLRILYNCTIVQAIMILSPLPFNAIPILVLSLLTDTSMGLSCAECVGQCTSMEKTAPCDHSQVYVESLVWHLWQLTDPACRMQPASEQDLYVRMYTHMVHVFYGTITYIYIHTCMHTLKASSLHDQA